MQGKNGAQTGNISLKNYIFYIKSSWKTPIETNFHHCDIFPFILFYVFFCCFWQSTTFRWTCDAGRVWKWYTWIELWKCWNFITFSYIPYCEGKSTAIGTKNEKCPKTCVNFGPNKHIFVGVRYVVLHHNHCT